MLSLRDVVVGKMFDFEDIGLPLLRAQKYKKMETILKNVSIFFGGFYCGVGFFEL